jgi:hypothetical protein
MSEQLPGRSRRQSPKVFYIIALLLALLLFTAHAIVLFDVAGRLLLESREALEGALGFHHSSKLIVIGCFVVLFMAHAAEAAVWALLLRWWGLASGFGEGFYFTAATVTTLGYGDVTLPPPWRQVGPLLAIAGVLKFGCSSAFLFVVMQAVWAKHLI